MSDMLLQPPDLALHDVVETVEHGRREQELGERKNKEQEKYVQARRASLSKTTREIQDLSLAETLDEQAKFLPSPGAQTYARNRVQRVERAAEAAKSAAILRGESSATAVSAAAAARAAAEEEAEALARSAAHEVHLRAATTDEAHAQDSTDHFIAMRLSHPDKYLSSTEPIERGGRQGRRVSLDAAQKGSPAAWQARRASSILAAGDNPMLPGAGCDSGASDHLSQSPPPAGTGLQWAREKGKAQSPIVRALGLTQEQPSFVPAAYAAADEPQASPRTPPARVNASGVRAVPLEHAALPAAEGSSLSIGASLNETYTLSAEVRAVIDALSRFVAHTAHVEMGSEDPAKARTTMLTYKWRQMDAFVDTAARSKFGSAHLAIRAYSGLLLHCGGVVVPEAVVTADPLNGGEAEGEGFVDDELDGASDGDIDIYGFAGIQDGDEDEVTPAGAAHGGDGDDSFDVDDPPPVRAAGAGWAAALEAGGRPMAPATALAVRAPALLDRLHGYVECSTIAQRIACHAVCKAWRAALRWQQRPAIQTLGPGGEVRLCYRNTIAADGRLAEFLCASLGERSCAAQYSKLVELEVGAATAPLSLGALAVALGAGACSCLIRLRLHFSPDADVAHYDAFAAAFGRKTCCCAQTLRSFALRGSAAGEDAATPIAAAAAHLSQLRVLDLYHCQLGSRGVMTVAKKLEEAAASRGGGSGDSRQFSRVRRLILGRNFGAHGAGRMFHAMISAGACGALRELDLSANAMGAAAAKTVGAVIAGHNVKAQLRHIDLSRNEGVAELLGVELHSARKAMGTSSAPKLKTLALSAVKLSATAAVSLVRALRGAAPRLERLDLSHNALPGAIFEELAKTLTTPGAMEQLRVLQMSHNLGGVGGIPALLRAFEDGESGAGNELRCLDIACVGGGLGACIELGQTLLRGTLPNLIECFMGRNAAADAPELKGRFGMLAEARPKLRVYGLDDDILGRYLI